MLLDPLEEEFDLPPTAIELGDGERRQGEVVGQEDQRLAGFRILEPNAAERCIEALALVEADEGDGLVADQPGRAIDWMRVAALGLEVRLAAGHEEAAGLVEAVETLEVEEAAIHDVERAGLGQELIEDVDLVHLAVADIDEGRDVPAQIEQGMQLDRSLGRADCALPLRECPGGRAGTAGPADRPRCRASFRGRSVARRPCTGIDPGRRTISPSVRRHND